MNKPLFNLKSMITGSYKAITGAGAGAAHRDESLNRAGTRAISPLIFVRSF